MVESIVDEGIVAVECRSRGGEGIESAAARAVEGEREPEARVAVDGLLRGLPGVRRRQVGGARAIVAAAIDVVGRVEVIDLRRQIRAELAEIDAFGQPLDESMGQHQLVQQIRVRIESDGHRLAPIRGHARGDERVAGAIDKQRRDARVRRRRQIRPRHRDTEGVRSIDRSESSLSRGSQRCIDRVRAGVDAGGGPIQTLVGGRIDVPGDLADVKGALVAAERLPFGRIEPRKPGRATVRRIREIAGGENDALIISRASIGELVGAEEPGVLGRDPDCERNAVIAQGRLDRLQIRFLSVGGEHQHFHRQAVARAAEQGRAAPDLGCRRRRRSGRPERQRANHWRRRRRQRELLPTVRRLPARGKNCKGGHHRVPLAHHRCLPHCTGRVTVPPAVTWTGVMHLPA